MVRVTGEASHLDKLENEAAQLLPQMRDALDALASSDEEGDDDDEEERYEDDSFEQQGGGGGSDGHP